MKEKELLWLKWGRGGHTITYNDVIMTSQYQKIGFFRFSQTWSSMVSNNSYYFVKYNLLFSDLIFGYLISLWRHRNKNGNQAWLNDVCLCLRMAPLSSCRAENLTSEEIGLAIKILSSKKCCSQVILKFRRIGWNEELVYICDDKTVSQLITGEKLLNPTALKKSDLEITPNDKEISLNSVFIEYLAQRSYFLLSCFYSKLFCLALRALNRDFLWSFPLSND